MLKLLEGANGTLAFLLIFACFMFGVYMAREILENGVKRVRLQAAISLFVAFAPEAASRIWIWYWRHLDNRGADVDSMLHSPVLLITALIQNSVSPASYGSLRPTDGAGRSGSLPRSLRPRSPSRFPSSLRRQQWT